MKTNKKILIMGASGMLGHKLWLSWQYDFEVFGTVRKPINNKYSYIFKPDRLIEGVTIEDQKMVNSVINDLKPDFVINCIGIVKQLDVAKDAIASIQTNALFPHQLSKLCQKSGVKLIHLSTDCVFSGNKGSYKETDIPDGRDLYGLSKLMGEVKEDSCLTIRTSIIGRELETKHGLLQWFLSQNHQEVKGFEKAIFTGFTTNYLAKIIKRIIENETNITGLYHVASAPINKYQLLNTIKDIYQLDIIINKDIEFSCNRSLNGSRFNSLLNFHSPSWSELIKQMYEEDNIYYKI